MGDIGLCRTRWALGPSASLEEQSSTPQSHDFSHPCLCWQLCSLVGFYVFCVSEDFKGLLRARTGWSSAGSSVCWLWAGFWGWEVGRTDSLERQYSRKETLFYVWSPNFDFCWSSLDRIVSDTWDDLHIHHNGVCGSYAHHTVPLVNLLYGSCCTFSTCKTDFSKLWHLQHDIEPSSQSLIIKRVFCY